MTLADLNIDATADQIIDTIAKAVRWQLDEYGCFEFELDETPVAGTDTVVNTVDGFIGWYDDDADGMVNLEPMIGRTIDEIESDVRREWVADNRYALEEAETYARMMAYM